MGDNLTREESALLDGVTAFISEVQVLRQTITRLDGDSTRFSNALRDHVESITSLLHRMTSVEKRVQHSESLHGLDADCLRVVDAVKELHEAKARAASWPAPQPIETAPLADLLVWSETFGRWRTVKVAGFTSLEDWRDDLATNGAHRAWLPMPPPPGGA